MDGQKQHLEMSFRYYYRGHQHGVATSDLGYTGINAAFVLDLLGEIEADAEPDGFGGAAARRALAREIRKDIVAGLKAIMDTPAASGYWAAVTLGEAYFGLGDYDNALAWLQTAKSRAAQGWQRETTARQLAHLASIQERAAAAQQAPAPAEAAAARVPDGLDPAVASAIVAAGLSATRETGPSPVVRARPYDVVREFLDLPEDVIRGAFLGKVGLALSGGGFRASLFHIGVLARLAEHDILRRVEVLSCVSGGSIIGAHYYLELRHLLQSKTDDEISRERLRRAGPACGGPVPPRCTEKRADAGACQSARKSPHDLFEQVLAHPSPRRVVRGRDLQSRQRRRRREAALPRSARDFSEGGA